MYSVIPKFQTPVVYGTSKPLGRHSRVQCISAKFQFQMKQLTCITCSTVASPLAHEVVPLETLRNAAHSGGFSTLPPAVTTTSTPKSSSPDTAPAQLPPQPPAQSQPPRAPQPPASPQVQAPAPVPTTANSGPPTARLSAMAASFPVRRDHARNPGTAVLHRVIDNNHTVSSPTLSKPTFVRF